MNQLKRIQLFLFSAIVCIAGVGCATGPDPATEMKQTRNELSITKQELSQSQQQNSELSQQNDLSHQRISDQEVQLVQLKDHSDKQNESLQKQATIINTLSDKLKLQKKELATREAELAKADTEKPDQKKPEEQVKGKYHLRIISLPDRERYEQYVKNLQNHLSKDDISDVIARKSGNFWVVDIGFFPSFKDNGAMALKSKMQEYKYEGIKQFRDCLYVKY